MSDRTKLRAVHMRVARAASVLWILASVAGFQPTSDMAGRAVFTSAQAADAGTRTTSIPYVGDGSDLQQAIDAVPTGASLCCDPDKPIVLTAPATIRRAMTLKGLHAKLPEGLGKTALIVVAAEGVVLADLELHGNFASVNQQDREALVLIHRGSFRVERCRFYDSSKDGVQVCPKPGGGDLVGGTIKDIEGFRLGRDAVSISGGNQGLKVRDVTVENVRLKKGYYRGAVEVSDGSDNISVRGVYAEACVYAIDVQDHGGGSAPNTNVEIGDVTAVDCRHVIRTANSPRGHAKLTLRNLTAKNCEAPVQISNTTDVVLDGLKIAKHRSERSPPVSFKNCRSVILKNLAIDSAHFETQAVRLVDCRDVKIEGLPKPGFPLTE